MQEQFLTNRDYVKIVDDAGAASFGGSQRWFLDASYASDKTMAGVGCGSIAAADFMLYTSATHTDMGSSPARAVLRDAAGAYLKSSYMPFAADVFARYARPAPGLGTTGTALARGLNRYFRDYAIAHRAEWRFAMSGDAMLRKISDMLARDLPVITVIPAFTRLLRKKMLPMRSSLVAPRTAAFRGTNYDKLAGHFIVITALRKGVDDAPVLEVSSWGRRYFINYADYRRYVNWSVGAVTASLIYIK